MIDHRKSHRSSMMMVHAGVFFYFCFLGFLISTVLLFAQLILMDRSHLKSQFWIGFLNIRECHKSSILWIQEIFQWYLPPDEELSRTFSHQRISASVSFMKLQHPFKLFELKWSKKRWKGTLTVMYIYILPTSCDKYNFRRHLFFGCKCIDIFKIC